MYIIYGKDSCPYCVKAVKLLSAMGLDYDYVNIDYDEDAKSFVVDNLGAKTVPQIFNKHKHIGGYDELYRKLIAESD